MNSRPLAAVVGLVVLLAMPSRAMATELIQEMNVRATLETDRTVEFTETVTYDFRDAERHGIYRVIPETYSRNGGTYRYRLDVTGVTRDGQSEPYTESMAGGERTIKIGSADITISGAHAYALTYQTDRALNFFADHDELYWNVTGNGWPVPIERASMTLLLPEGMSASQVNTICFTGAFGSTEHACEVTQSGARELIVTSRRVLQPFEGLTVAFGFPKGVIAPPTTAEVAWQILRDNGVLFFPIMALVVMFVMWWRRGRDPEIGTIIPEYESPQGARPAVLGAIQTNGDVPARTITATIIDLARRGYLHIRFDEKKRFLGLGSTMEYTFVKQKDADAELNAAEQALLTGLFGDGSTEVKMDELVEKKFYTSVAAFRTSVQKEVDTMGVFAANPSAVRGAYISIAFFVAFGMFFVFGSTGLGALAAVLTGITIAVFGFFMPQRTSKGAKLLAATRGFKWFLSVTEKDRLAFHNAPQRTPTQFMALLPFAIVFEVEKQWAAQFASMDLPPPSWAEGSAISHMSMLHMASSLDGMHAAAASSGYSAPSSAGSGGSGFSGGGSGGGGGGGGGGSW